MIHLIIAGVLVAALYVVLVETLFKESKCKGTADMTGKTAIITGEFFLINILIEVTANYLRKNVALKRACRLHVGVLFNITWDTEESLHVF